MKSTNIWILFMIAVSSTSLTPLMAGGSIGDNAIIVSTITANNISVSSITDLSQIKFSDGNTLMSTEVVDMAVLEAFMSTSDVQQSKFVNFRSTGDTSLNNFVNFGSTTDTKFDTWANFRSTQDTNILALNNFNSTSSTHQDGIANFLSTSSTHQDATLNFLSTAGTNVQNLNAFTSTSDARGDTFVNFRSTTDTTLDNGTSALAKKLINGIGVVAPTNTFILSSTNGWSAPQAFQGTILTTSVVQIATTIVFGVDTSSFGPNFVTMSSAAIYATKGTVGLDMTGGGMIKWDSNTGAPNSTTWVGTRLVMWPGASNTSYAQGIEAGAMWFNTGAAYKFYRGGTAKHIINAADNFGVNTITPATKFEVFNGSITAKGGIIVSTIMFVTAQGSSRTQENAGLEILGSSVPDSAGSSTITFVMNSTKTYAYCVFYGSANGQPTGDVFVRFNNSVANIYTLCRTTCPALNASNSFVNRSSQSAVGLPIFGENVSTSTQRYVRIDFMGNENNQPKIGNFYATSISSTNQTPIVSYGSWGWGGFEQINQISFGFSQTNRPYAGGAFWRVGSRCHCYGRND